MHYGQVMIDLEGLSLTPTEALLIAHPRVAGIILFARNYSNKSQLKHLVHAIRAIRPHLLLAVDHEGGRVWRFSSGFSPLPPAQSYGLDYENSPIKALKASVSAGHLMAAELIDCGIDLSFAPVLDIDTGLSAVIQSRGFYPTPQGITDLAGAFIDGMQSAGMQATGKHFPGHGGCSLDSHIEEPIDPRALNDLMQADILPFKNLGPKLGAIMPAHVIYPAVDSVPAGFSKIWLQDILREQLGFKGAIISDCLSMHAALMEGDLLANAKMALKAGCDMVLLCQQNREFVKSFLAGLDTVQSPQSSERLAALEGRFVAAVV